MKFMNSTKQDADAATVPHEDAEFKEENINELKSSTMLDYMDKASDSASKDPLKQS